MQFNLLYNMNIPTTMQHIDLKIQYYTHAYTKGWTLLKCCLLRTYNVLRLD